MRPGLHTYGSLTHAHILQCPRPLSGPAPRPAAAPPRRRRQRLPAVGASNLGELERFAGVDATHDFPPAIPLDSYAPEPRFDGAAASMAIVSFIVLAGIGSDRIFNLSALFKRAALKWKEQRAYERRVETMEARAALEAALEADPGDEEMGEGPGAVE